MFFLFLISLHVHIKRPYSFPLIIKKKKINNQYLTVLLCWGDLPRPRAMVLPLYLKLIVQFQDIVAIIDIKYPLAY